MAKNILYILLFLILMCLLCTCSLPGWDEDLHEFVELGLSPVYLSSSTWRGAGLDAGLDARHGEEVTVSVRLNNPKSFNLTYTLSADSALVIGTPSAPVGTDSAVDQVTPVSFTFTPSEAAEHGDVFFTLGLYSPSINRTFKPAIVRVHCDSPPSPVENLTAGITSAKKACIGFTLPENYANADISAVTITYVNTSTGTTTTVTENVSRTGGGLTSVPVPALLNSDAGKYVRYFCPTDVTPGNPYSFSITTIDESGKVCTSDPLSADVTGNELYLGYNSNGGTGSVAAHFGYYLTTTVTVSGASSLTNPGFTFMGWNTASNASGIAYQPGESFTFPEASTMLYAQWLGNGDLPGGITPPGYADFSITQGGIDATIVSVNTNDNLSLSMSLEGTTYQWYINCVEISGATSKDYIFNPEEEGITTDGFCTLTATCLYNDVWYSADLVVTVVYGP